MTRSLSMMVGIRWATVMTVHLLVSSLILLWITLSVAVSTDAVASSKTNIFLLCSSTLARHTSCLCPMLQFSPSSATVPVHKVLETICFSNFSLPSERKITFVCLRVRGKFSTFHTWHIKKPLILSYYISEMTFVHNLTCTVIQTEVKLHVLLYFQENNLFYAYLPNFLICVLL